MSAGRRMFTLHIFFGEVCRKLVRIVVPFLCSLLPIPIMADLPASSPRVQSRLPAEGWRFLAGDDPRAGEPGFDDADWEIVSVPHTWNAVDGGDGGGTRSDPASGYRRGAGWYRCVIQLDKAAPGTRRFLRFEGASQVADVFVNGRHAGRHEGAFTAFCFEVTGLLQPGANLLAVRVDNSWTEEIAPVEGDFVVFGGLYRPVHLITSGPLCISPLEHGGPGVEILQRAVSSTSARLDVRVLPSGREGHVRGDVTVEVLACDTEGRVVARVGGPVAAGARHFECSLDIAHPHLWDGRRDPYLHVVSVELLEDGVTVDSMMQQVGLRSLGFDESGRFLLNGRPLRLRGVNRHQDREGKGWAVSDADHAEDVELILEMGANAVRLAHYPQADRFYELCDRAGLLVWAEIPLVNRLGNGPRFAETTRTQLRELIHQQLNRTSIFAWGLWNEIGMSPGPDPIGLVRSLEEIAHDLDPTRPTVAAAFAPTQRLYPDLVRMPDQVGWNLYPGWYGSEGPSQLGPMLDALHARDPKCGLSVSEYGAGASVLHHQQGIARAPIPDGEWHPEEWQAIVHEQTWSEIERRPFVWGSFVWNMFDFASAWRAEGDREGINDKGLVTYDRHVRKDAFFFYKAAWSNEPMIHITSRRHAIRQVADSTIKVYSNCDVVELRINGRLLPRADRSGVVHVWPGVRLERGENRIEASGRRGGHDTHDACVWRVDDSEGSETVSAATRERETSG